MFKHTHEHHHGTPEQQPEVAPPAIEKKAEEPPVSVVEKPLKDTSPAALRELLEKNLKWSQIIYEQNRRINSKLFWAAVASWARLIFWIVVVIGSILLTISLYKQFTTGQGGFTMPEGYSGNTSTTSLESMLQFLPLDAAQKQQLKSFLK